MKKDEIVVLSNEIEIINEVEVDWSKYKGRNTNQSKNTYVGLCELLQKKGHTLESDYVNNSTKVDINFNCGHSAHKIRPNDYKNGYGCPICGGKSSEYAKEELYKIAQVRGHIVIGEYINAKTKILIDFNCGHKPHNIRPNAYKIGNGCPECHKGKIIKAMNRKSKKAELELYELVEKNKHKILGEYKGTLVPILIDFNCGHSAHKIRPRDYKKGQRCPECAKEKHIKIMKEKSKNIELKLYKMAKENGHIILGAYKGDKTKILIDFNCGHEPHNIAPYAYKQGKGCPKCKASKGEKEVVRILKEMNINYQEQYKFEDCRSINPLPFDFYVSELNLCIEYDGEHHYKSVVYYNKFDSEHKRLLAQKIAEERLRETKRRDKIKTDYCKNNGINLIRIPYWEFDNIEKILKKELSKYIQAVA